jgi:diadenylate cyclase
MADFFLPFTTGAVQFSWRDVVDIIIVAVIIYSLIRIMSGTRAIQVLKGLGIILILAIVFSILNLQTVTWMLGWLLNAAAVVLVILFQPEIRRALEKLGGGKFFSVVSTSQNEDADRIVEELMRAIINMSKRKVGALIVFERKTGLKDIIETGTVINAEITSELIENIFYPNTPLHDGAMIVKEGKIIAAGCFLPLSDNKQISSELGTRHRAALGVSEVSDSYTIVVSEETGVISYMFDGMLTRYLDIPTLRDILERIFIKTDNADKKPPAFKFRRKVGEK